MLIPKDRLAISYGQLRYLLAGMIAVLVMLIMLNMAIQWFGDHLAHRLNRRR